MKKITLTFGLIIFNLLAISAQSSNYPSPYCGQFENVNPPNNNTDIYYPNQRCCINQYRPNNQIGYYHPHQIDHYPFYYNGWRPISSHNFNLGYSSIIRYVFDENRLVATKRFVRNQHLSVNQVIKLMNVFTWEKTKLKFAKYAYSKTYDTENYFRVFDFLFFETSRIELDKFIEHQLVK